MEARMAVAASNEGITTGRSRARGTLCLHCGASVEVDGMICTDGQVFCCSGCRVVYQLIRDQGLERFYELRDGPQLPVAAGVFQGRNLEWIDALCVESCGCFEIEIQGMSCIACAWLIRRVFERRPGALEIEVDMLMGVGKLTVDHKVFKASEFAALLQKFGYHTGPRSGSNRKLSTRGLVLRMGVCGALALNAMLFTVPGYCGLQIGDSLASFFAKGAMVCASASMLVGASYFIRRALTALRMGSVHMDLPIALGLVAAYAGSVFGWLYGAAQGVYFDFVSVFTFLMLVGRWVQQAALANNRNRVLQAPLSLLNPEKGDVFDVPNGAPVPVRSVLRSNDAVLGMEWINGESEARHCSAGQTIASGSINLSGTPLTLEALEDWKDCLLAKLLAPPAEKPELQERVQRFVLWYLTFVLLIAGAGFVFWIGMGQGIQVALQVCISVLVVSCPCASGVALPLLTDLAAARMREYGVFVREPGVWGRLSEVSVVVFDKTGTLTGDLLCLKTPAALAQLDTESASALRWLVSRSMHPAATSLREALGFPPLHRSDASEAVPELPGYGLQWRDAHGRNWRLGRSAWVLAGSAGSDNVEGSVFGCDGKLVAVFEFEERLRPGALTEVDALRNAGYEIHILSGDHPARVAAVAHELCLPQSAVNGAQTPEDKADWLRSREGSQRALMLGDGANDSLAFAQSLVTGTPAVDRGVLEQRADFYYLGRGLSGVRFLLEMAAFKKALTRRVLVLTSIYNAVVIWLALSGLMHPLLASIVMPLSSVATLALVLHAFKDPKNPEGVIFDHAELSGVDGKPDNPSEIQVNAFVSLAPDQKPW